jgi:hypothetical protein
MERKWTEGRGALRAGGQGKADERWGKESWSVCCEMKIEVFVEMMSMFS